MTPLPVADCSTTEDAFIQEDHWPAARHPSGRLSPFRGRTGVQNDAHMIWNGAVHPAYEYPSRI